MSFPPGYKKNFTLPEQYNEITGSLRWVNSNNVNMLYKYEATGCLHNVWISDHVLNVDLIFARPLPGSVWPYLILSLIFFAPLSTHPGWFTSICQNKQTNKPKLLPPCTCISPCGPPLLPHSLRSLLMLLSRVLSLLLLQSLACLSFQNQYVIICAQGSPPPAVLFSLLLHWPRSTSTLISFSPTFFILPSAFQNSFSINACLRSVWIYLCLKVCLSTEALS